MRLFILGVSALVLASAGPAASFQTQERDVSVVRAEQARQDGVIPGGVCKSRAFDKGDAEGFCGERLQCSSKAPPQTLRCKGTAARWTCRCK